MKVVILAAGIGSRLGISDPKPLTKLKNGESILQRQITYLSEYLGMNNIIVIVGYKKELIMESFPNLVYVYNNFFLEFYFSLIWPTAKRENKSHITREIIQ